MTTIKVCDQYVSIHIDTHGNLYFEINNNDKLTSNCQSFIYQLNIDRNNEPYLEIGDYNIINNQEQNPNFHVGTIIKSEKFVNDKYFPEDNGHTLVNTTQNIDSDEELNEDSIFTFYQKENNITINDRNFGDINALYDIFIYNDSCSESQLIFQSKLQNEICPYRVILYTSGKFFFRAIGCFIENKYKLEIKNNIIECIRE